MRILALGLLTCTLLACVHAVQAAPALSDQIFERINQERSKKQLASLTPDARLQELAHQWAERLARLGRMEHRKNISTLQKAHGFSYLNENLYRFSTIPTPERVVNAWMKSAGHRRNLLTAKGTLGAVAVANGQDGSTYIVFHAAHP